jgi:hypothetical protein
LGIAEDLAHFEWSPADDCDVTDPGEWWGFMPALGITIPPEAVAADLRTMALPEWRRACCNQWLDETDDSGWRVIPRDQWELARL